MKKPKDLADIDEDRLDQEWLEHPKRVRHYSELTADANRAFNNAEDQLELIEANLMLWIAKRPDKYGLPDHPTVTMIRAAMRVDPRYKKRKKRLLKAQHRLDLLKGAMRALSHRKEALENATNLHNSNYYSTPRSPKDRETRERLEDQRQETIRKGIKKKRRKD